MPGKFIKLPGNALLKNISHKFSSVDNSCEVSNNRAERNAKVIDFIKENDLGFKQGSDKWVKQRKYTIGGSELSVITGDNPFKNRKELIIDKTTGKRWIGNIRTMCGNLFEDLIQKYCEYQFNTTIYGTDAFFKGGVEHQTYSPDGLGVINLCDLSDSMENNNTTNNDSEKIISVLFEFKAPFSRIPGKSVPKHYKPQVLCGLESIPVVDIGMFVESIIRFASLSQYDWSADYNNSLYTKIFKDYKPIGVGVIYIYEVPEVLRLTDDEFAEYIGDGSNMGFVACRKNKDFLKKKWKKIKNENLSKNNLQNKENNLQSKINNQFAAAVEPFIFNNGITEDELNYVYSKIPDYFSNFTNSGETDDEINDEINETNETNENPIYYKNSTKLIDFAHSTVECEDIEELLLGVKSGKYITKYHHICFDEDQFVKPDTDNFGDIGGFHPLHKYNYCNDCSTTDKVESENGTVSTQSFYLSPIGAVCWKMFKTYVHWVEREEGYLDKYSKDIKEIIETIEKINNENDEEQKTAIRNKYLYEFLSKKK